MVPPDFGRSQVFRSIGQVAEAGARKFFTRTNIRALVINAQPDENENTTDDKQAGVTPEKGSKDVRPKEGYSERKIPPGSVLVVKGSFAARWRTSQAALFKKKSKEYTTVDIPYLKCVDLDGTEVLVPFSSKGRYSIVYEKGLTDVRAVYRMKDILSDLQTPAIVRMIFGKAPVVPCIFTGMLALKSKTTEDSFIASTVLNKRNVLFEIPMRTSCDVFNAINTEQYENLRTYIDASLLCKKYALKFGQLIKLAPELDTNQSMIQHVPTERQKSRDESLKTLDLIANFSLTDDEPRDYFMEGSDSDSIQSADAAPVGVGQMMELREIELPRVSQIYSDA